MQELLNQLEKDKIIQRYNADDDNFGIQQVDKALLLKALNNFTPKSEQSEKCIKMLASHFTLPHVAYLPLKWFFERLNSPIENISEKNISLPGEKSKKKGSRRGSSGGVHPPIPINFGQGGSAEVISLDVREIPLSQVSRVIKKPQEEIGIWISKKNLDHVKTWNGKYDLSLEQNRELFDTLEEHFQIEYNETGWAYPVKEEDGYLLKVHVHQNPRNIGTLRIMAPRNFDYQTLFQNAYFKIFNFLTPEEHQVLLEGMLNEDTDSKLFYVELANAIGPKKIVDEKLKGAKLSCRVRTGAGGKTWVDVEIDYSDPSAPEMEFKGKHDPTALTRDLVVNAFKVTDSIMEMKRNLVNNQYHISEKIDVMGNGIQTNGQVLQLVQKNINISHADLATKIKYIKRQFPQLKSLFIELSRKNSRENIKLRKVLANLIVGVMNLQAINHEDHEQILNEAQQAFIDTSNDMNEGFQEVHGVINGVKDEIVQTINDHFDSLKNLIIEEFENVKFRIKNALYLILRKIDTGPGMTIKKMQSELSIPRSTLVTYLNKLHAKGFIQHETKRTGRRGRPPRIFKSTKKIKKILQKLNQSKKEE